MRYTDDVKSASSLQFYIKSTSFTLGFIIDKKKVEKNFKNKCNKNFKSYGAVNKSNSITNLLFFLIYLPGTIFFIILMFFAVLCIRFLLSFPTSLLSHNLIQLIFVQFQCHYLQCK